MLPDGLGKLRDFLARWDAVFGRLLDPGVGQSQVWPCEGCTRTAAVATADASITLKQRIRAVLMIHHHGRASPAIRGLDRTSLVRRRVARALGLGSEVALVRRWEMEILGVWSTTQPHAWAYGGGKDDPRLARARADMRMLDLQSALEQGAEIEDAPRCQRTLNVVQALRHALQSREDRAMEMITELERIAAKYVDEGDDRLEVPGAHLDGLKQDRNNLHVVRKALCKIIDDVLGKHGVPPINKAVRLNPKRLDAVLAAEASKPSDIPRPDPLGEVSWEVTNEVFMFISGGRLDAVLPRRTYLTRVGSVEAVVFHALIRNAGTKQIVGAILFALGLPWDSSLRKNFAG